jgi:hypothetical protein
VLGAVDDAAGVVAGQAAEPVLVDDGAGGGGQGGQVRAVRGGDRPDPVQARAGEELEIAGAVLPGVEDDGHVGGLLPAGRSDRLVPGLQLPDHVRELGDVGPVAGVGVPGQRDPAVPGDHQAQPDQPQVDAFLLRLRPTRCRPTTHYRGAFQFCRTIA